MKNILDVYFLPPMAIARLGSSDTPLESYSWAEDSNVFGGNMTVIEPAISFKVKEDGSLRAYLPEVIRFRDRQALRPVAPFFELWAQVQSSPEGTVADMPLNLDLLAEVGASLENIRYRLTLGNQKAALRTHTQSCSYTARIEVVGSDHERKGLQAFSRHDVNEVPLVAQDRPIPLGHFQVIRPIAKVTTINDVDVDLGVVRVRFTPAKGEVYGPPSAIAGPASPLPPGQAVAPKAEAGRVHEIVPSQNRILNENTPWVGYRLGYTYEGEALPSDSYDGANVGDNRSWGVVDDTCDGVLEAFVAIADQRFVATARIFVGTPDFAPDRRPFYSIADDLADRDLPPVEVSEKTLRLTQGEISDLFHRIFETVSLMSLDSARTRAVQQNDSSSSENPNFPHLPKLDERSMTREDQPFVDKTPDLLIEPGPQQASVAVPRDRLPFSDVAHFAHKQLVDQDTMIEFFRTYKHHIHRLIRPPFGYFEQLAENPEPNSEPNPHFRDPRVVRDTLYDMRMPPYMRDSDENPLSLTRRQYAGLMAFLELLETLPNAD